MFCKGIQKIKMARFYGPRCRNGRSPLQSARAQPMIYGFITV